VYRFCKPSDENKRQQKVVQILEKLIDLTIEEVEMYPSVQAKIWGSIGQVCLILMSHTLCVSSGILFICRQQDFFLHVYVKKHTHTHTHTHHCDMPVHSPGNSDQVCMCQ